MGGIFGDKNAGKRAAAAQNKMTQLGINELNPFVAAGKEQLSGLAEGATAGGLDKRLAELFNSDTFSSLVGGRQRGIQGQLAAGGLTRSGAGLEAMAGVPAELALQLEQMLTGRSQNIAGQGLGAATGVANLFRDQGGATANGIVTDAETKAAVGGQIAQLASGIFFSDERLKQNIVQISDIGGLPVCEWDWIDKAKGTVIEKCPNVGFLAQDVKRKYPEFVGEESGWLFVNYEGLMERLQSDLDARAVTPAVEYEARSE